MRTRVSCRRPRVLVVYKKSKYQQDVLERKDSHLRRLLRTQHPDAIDAQQGHTAHQQTLRAVLKDLKRMDVESDVVYRTDLRARVGALARYSRPRTDDAAASGYDLVVSIGGDGTLLHGAHAVDDIPILGVNSDTARSEAVFCAATQTTFNRLLEKALQGALPTLTLYRLQLRLNGRRLRPLVLNEVLVAHDDPATLSRYRLKVGARQEIQKSSGLWVASAAGSSSAILAAGGTRLDWGVRRFQYQPRELYRGRLSRYHLTGGVLRAGIEVEVTWLMRQGSAFIDGSHTRVPLRFGDRLRIGLSLRSPLRLLGVGGPRARRRRTR